MSFAMRSLGVFGVAFPLSFVGISLAAPPPGANQPSSPHQAPLRMLGPAADQPDHDTTRLLEAVQQQRRLIASQVRAEVHHQLRDARSRAWGDPEQARTSLKLALDRVLRTTELPADTRAQLRAELEEALRAVDRRAASKDDLDAQRAAERAAALDQRNVADALAQDQQKLAQLVDRFDSLMDEGRYAQAGALGERHIAEIAPEAPVATSARLVPRQRGAHLLNVALRDARHKGVVGTLATVETSHMPFADDLPMVYPRAEVWDELSRRRARYARADLGNVGPAEARIRRELDAPTNIDFIETPLDQAVAYLKDLHGIEIHLDTKALEQSRMFSDTPVTATMQGISLRSGLRLLLRPLDLTYVITDEVLLVTTHDVASQQVIARVYPVEDLVMPIQPPGLGTGGIGDFGPSSQFGSGQNGIGVGFPGQNGPGFNGFGNGQGFNRPGIGQY